MASVLVYAPAIGGCSDLEPTEKPCSERFVAVASAEAVNVTRCVDVITA